MCTHNVKQRSKVIKIRDDKYLQVLQFCSSCKRQLSKKVTELKRG